LQATGAAKGSASVSTSLAVLIAAIVLTASALFWRVLRKELYEVRNRGVNQALAVSVGRAGLRTANLVLKFGLVLYLLATFYAYYRFQRVCARDAWMRDAYERGSLVEHVTDALRWPLYLEDPPPCAAARPTPVPTGPSS